jgi:hypothetical protein
LLEEKFSFWFNFTWPFDSPVIQERAQSDRFIVNGKFWIPLQVNPSEVTKRGEKIEVKIQLFH